MDWPGTSIILDKKYNIANSSCHFGSYGSIWTGPSPKKYYMDLRSFSPYNIFWVTDRSIYCHMTLSAMNYLLYRLMNERIDIENLSTGMVSTEPKESKKLLIFFHSDHVFSLQFRSTRDTRWLPCQI